MGKSCKVSKLSLMCACLVLVSLATFALWIVVIVGDAKEVTAAWDRYRLPKTLVPEFYNVTLWPRLQPDPDSGLYIFTGSSTVQFVCVEATNLILIHSNKLNYTRMDTQLARGGASSIQLKDKLVSGQRYQMHTRFTGELADDLVGFYRSEYEEYGVQRIIAISQMHPTHSRKTFQ
ncbi:hypothetical protein OJAV_G00059040 [Oryzias javanicus]|uniref:Aminopeptidase N-like N-terminal domain-containing protein n=1 Tax=Oryzias javanicus TaxID=123683 RepID=A0A3S2MBV3_ORYJA|nr:hypothetical protein OJAV_G00059040 [Oryzias javanicus]